MYNGERLKSLIFNVVRPFKPLGARRVAAKAKHHRLFRQSPKGNYGRED